VDVQSLRSQKNSGRPCSSTTKITSGLERGKPFARSVLAWLMPVRPSCARPWPHWSTRRVWTSTYRPRANFILLVRLVCQRRISSSTGTTSRWQNSVRIVVDSFDELDRLDALHSNGLAPPDVLIRITPGVEAHTHEFIATGRDDSKFGFTVSTGLATRAIERAMRSPSVRVRGIHAHIGSQVFRVDSFARAAEVIAAVGQPYDLDEVSVGGGLGVPYVMGEDGASITAWASVVHDALDAAGVRARILAEPGRSIAASAAITAYTVGTVKALDGIRTYVAVDGGMSDNPRPVLYGSGYESFLPSRPGAVRDLTIRVVGKHCESGDVLVREGQVPSEQWVRITTQYCGHPLSLPRTGTLGSLFGARPSTIS